MFPLLLLAATTARADTPLMILHLDPGVTATQGPGPEPALNAKLEFPIAWFLVHTVPAFLCLISGQGSVDDVMDPGPPITPQYVFYARHGLEAGDRLDWGGGVGLRYRPLVRADSIVPAARGLWVDLNGRYGTVGWGLDGGVGWDLRLGQVVSLGPALSGAWDGRGLWGSASLSLSFSLFGDRLGGEVTLPGE